MKRYLINLEIAQNNRKIDTIKELRRCFGFGLLAAKNFVEQSITGNPYDDRWGGSLIVNERQLADACVLAVNSLPFTGPSFKIMSAKPIDDGNAIDVSSL